MDILWTVHGHFTGLVHRLKILYLCIYQRMGKEEVVNEDVLDSMGPEHDVNGME